MIEFFILMKKVPTKTHQQKKITCKNGKPVVYEDEKLKATRNMFEALLSKHRPNKLFTGPVRMTTKWCFEIKGKHKDGEWRTSRPDVTNLSKLLEDCMTTVGFWKDDSLIVSSITEKFWAEISGIYIKIEELEINDNDT